jgi:hypothetical protein
MPKEIPMEEEESIDDEIRLQTIQEPKRKEQTDPDGYLLRMHTNNDPTLPSYQLPSLEPKSTFQILSQIMYLRDEGILSLWKGVRNSCRI